LRTDRKPRTLSVGRIRCGRVSSFASDCELARESFGVIVPDRIVLMGDVNLGFTEMTDGSELIYLDNRITLQNRRPRTSTDASGRLLVG